MPLETDPSIININTDLLGKSQIIQLIFLGLSLESANFTAFSSVDILNYFLPTQNPAFGVSIAVASGNLIAVLISIYKPPQQKNYFKIGSYSPLVSGLLFVLVAVIFSANARESILYSQVLLVFFFNCFVQTFAMAHIYHMGGLLFSEAAIQHLQQGGVLGALAIFLIRVISKAVSNGTRIEFLTSAWLYFGFIGVLISSCGYYVFQKLFKFSTLIDPSLIESEKISDDSSQLLVDTSVDSTLLIGDDLQIVTQQYWKNLTLKCWKMLFLAGFILFWTVLFFPGVASVLYGVADYQWATVFLIGSFQFGDFCGKFLVEIVHLSKKTIWLTAVLHMLLSILIIAISQNYSGPDADFWGNIYFAVILFYCFGVSNGLNLASSMMLALTYDNMSQDDKANAGSLGNFSIQTGFFLGTVFGIILIRPVLYPNL